MSAADRPHRNKKANRTKRKKDWIRVRNLMRKYPDCAYDGDFYCDHIYEPDNPWVWVDFRFFHTTKKMYYAVAMVTANYAAHEKAHAAAIEHAYEKYPLENNDLVMNEDGLFTFEHDANYRERSDCIREQMLEEAAKTQNIIESIECNKYSDTCMGLFVTLNKPHIDAGVIREFIHTFRTAHGEPLGAKWKWKGDTVQIRPADYFPRSLFVPNSMVEF